jgi:hypothetical protein
MKSRIFVGSSRESKMLAESVRAHFLDIADVVIWDQDVFKLGKGTLETLLRAAREYDFAIFVLGPDDQIQYRGEAGTTPRGNVLFELGLFMGALGGDRVFGLFSDQKDLQIPSDFAGVTIAMYESKGLDREDFSSCKKATKGACDVMRAAILDYKPAARSVILTKKAVDALSAYLSFRQADGIIAVAADDAAAIKQFDTDCHQAMKDSRIYESIRDALGTQFGFYIQAIGVVREQPEDMRYLNCCLRPNPRASMTYLDTLMLRDPVKPKKGEIAKDIEKHTHDEPPFGQWLLSPGLDPAPFAVVVDFSEKGRWDADIILAYDTPLGFKIDVSATSEDYAPARTKLLKGTAKLTLGGLDSRFDPLRKMLSGREDDYMGTIIKSALFVPVHGWPGITLQILTRERLQIDTQTPEATVARTKPEDPPIRLTVDELMSIRLCGERLQGLLAHKVRPVPQDG